MSAEIIRIDAIRHAKKHTFEITVSENTVQWLRDYLFSFGYHTKYGEEGVAGNDGRYIEAAGEINAIGRALQEFKIKADEIPF